MKRITVTLATAVLCMSAAAWAGSLFPIDEYEKSGEAVKTVVNAVGSLMGEKGGKKASQAKSLAVIAQDSGGKDLADQIVNGLSESGSYIVIDRAQAEGAAGKSSRQGEELAQDVMKALKLQGLVIVRSWPTDGRDVLAVRIYARQAEGRPETMLFTLKKQPGRETGAPALLSGAPAPLRLELAGNYEVPIAARYMVVRDMDGDGSIEYAFSDGKKLHLYRREGAAWKNIWTGEAGDDRHYYVDAGDVNGNGKPELFVSAMRSGKVVTTAYEEKGGGDEGDRRDPRICEGLSPPRPRSVPAPAGF